MYLLLFVACDFAPQQDNIPMCTLRNFPSLIEHCIEWARAQFNDLFVEQAGDAKKFLDDRETYLAEARAALNAGRGGDLPKKIDTLKQLMVRVGCAFFAQ
jgi:ubiquitin-activating enzyme E1